VVGQVSGQNKRLNTLYVHYLPHSQICYMVVNDKINSLIEQERKERKSIFKM